MRLACTAWAIKNRVSNLHPTPALNRFLILYHFLTRKRRSTGSERKIPWIAQAIAQTTSSRYKPVMSRINPSCNCPPAITIIVVGKEYQSARNPIAPRMARRMLICVSSHSDMFCVYGLLVKVVLLEVDISWFSFCFCWSRARGFDFFHTIQSACGKYLVNR